jgi:hypothetical protein
MTKLLIFLSFSAFFSLSSFACDGGMFQNPPALLVANDLTRAEYEKRLSDFEEFFTPWVEEKLNSELIVFKSWSSNTINAFAERARGKVMINLFGGLARHPVVTRDGIDAVLCHELGHHLGGYPKKSGNRWSSAEGQSDYYATMKCLRLYWQNENNEIQGVPELVRTECAQSFSTRNEQALCERMSLAGKSVARLIQVLDHDSLEPRFETPEPERARRMVYTHPFAQCRLDTFYQGSLCSVSPYEDFDDLNPLIGSCNTGLGARPPCWFVINGI